MTIQQQQLFFPAPLHVNGTDYTIFPVRQTLAALAAGPLERLPYSLRLLLENLLRQASRGQAHAADIETLARWQPEAVPDAAIPFMPARIILQDFTGVPALVDLAAMRSALARHGGDPAAMNPLIPVDLIIDHSVQVDRAADDSFAHGASGGGALVLLDGTPAFTHLLPDLVFQVFSHTQESPLILPVSVSMSIRR